MKGAVSRAAHLVLGHVRRDLNVGHDWIALDVPVAEIGLGANVGDDLDSGRVEREVSSGIGQPGLIRSAHSCAGYEAGDNSGARFAPPWAGRRSSRASRTPSPSSCTCNRSPWRPISLPRPASPSLRGSLARGIKWRVSQSGNRGRADLLKKNRPSLGKHPILSWLRPPP